MNTKHVLEELGNSQVTWIAEMDNPLSVIPGHSIKESHGSKLPVAVVHATTGSLGPEPGRAKARLITKSPELLASLEKLVKMGDKLESILQEKADKAEMSYIPSFDLREAKALIKEVKG